jgi:hypothetical protein
MTVPSRRPKKNLIHLTGIPGRLLQKENGLLKSIQQIFAVSLRVCAARMWT